MKLETKNEGDFDLKEVWEIIKKRKSFLIIFILLVTMGAALYSFFIAKPVYEAKARVLVNLEKQAPVSLTHNLPDDFKGKEFFETQVALIKSRSLIKNVIQQLKLEDNPEFQSEDFAFLANLKAWFKSLSANSDLTDASSKSFEPYPYGLLVDKIKNRLDVKQVKSSRVLEISFQGKSPPLITEITNALTQEYIVKTREWYNASDGNTAGWIDNKLSDLNLKLKNSESKLQRFKQNRSFVEAKGGRELVSRKWSEISQELTKAASARLLLQTQIHELKSLKDDPLKLLLSQPFIFNANLSELQKNYIALNNDLSSLLKSKTPQHPDVVLLTQKLDLMNQKIPSEVDNFLSSLNIKLKATINQEKALTRVLEEQQKTIMKTDDDSLKFRFLKQEVELNEKLYNELLNKKKELEVTSNFNSSNISVVDSAEVPYLPVKPKKGLNIILAFLLSTFIGFTLVFFQESQDKALKTEADVDDHLPYYFWGSIARIPKKNGSSSFANLREFRSLKTQFLLKTKDSSNKIFLVTSPKPKEGKTFIASNLAISLGISGKKVLIIDGDFYNSKVTSIFNSTEKTGYVDDLNDCNKIFHKTGFDNVWVAPSGGVTREIMSTPDVFLSKGFQLFLKGAEERWDYILIKAPPVLATPDAKVLEKFCHGVILVLPSGTYDSASVQRIFNQLVSWGPKYRTEDQGKPHIDKPAKVMGIVINKMDPKYKEIEYKYYQNLG